MYEEACSCQLLHLCFALSYLPKAFSNLTNRQRNSLNKDSTAYSIFLAPIHPLWCAHWPKRNHKKTNKFWITGVTEAWACHLHPVTPHSLQAQEIQKEKSDEQGLLMLEYLKSLGLKYPILGSSDHPMAYLDEFSKSKGSASLLLPLTYLAAASSGRNLSVCTGWQLSRNLQAAAWSSRVTAYRKGKKKKTELAHRQSQANRFPFNTVMLYRARLQASVLSSVSIREKEFGMQKKNKTKALLPHPAPSCLPKKVSMKTRWKSQGAELRTALLTALWIPGLEEPEGGHDMARRIQRVKQASIRERE